RRRRSPAGGEAGKRVALAAALHHGRVALYSRAVSGRRGGGVNDYTTILEEALEAGAFTREGVIAEVRNVSEKDLAFRPHPESRSFVELAHHVIESGLMMSGELSRPDGDFQRKSYEGFLKEYGREVASKRSKGDLPAPL